MPTHELNTEAHPGPLTANTRIFGAVTGSLDSIPDGFSPDLIRDYVRTMTDELYPTQQALASLDDEVQVIFDGALFESEGVWNGENKKAGNFAPGTVSTDLVTYGQLQAVAIDQIFDISGLAPLPSEDAVTGSDLVIVWDESEGEAKQQTLDELADSLTYQPGAPASIRRRMGAKFQANWDIDEFGGTTFTDRMTAAVLAINGEQNIDLDMLARVHTLEAYLPVLTGDNFSIRGRAPGVSKIVVGASAGSQSTIFEFGSTANNCVNFWLSGLAFEWDNTPSLNEHALRFIRATQGVCHDLYWTDASSLVLVGADDGTANGGGRIVFSRWRGDANKGGAAQANFLIQKAGNLIFRDVHINSSQDSSAGGAIFAVKPTFSTFAHLRGFVDTLTLEHCGFQFFNPTLPEEPNGLRSKPVCILIDNSFGPVVNQFYRGNFLDHSSQAAIKIYQAADGGAGSGIGVEQLTNVRIACNRTAPDSGRAIDIECLSTNSAGAKRGLDISNHHATVSEAEYCARIAGTGFRNCSLSNNDWHESNAATAKPGYLNLAADGWRLINNGGRPVSNVAAMAHGIVIDPSVTDCHVAHNHFPLLAAGGKAVSHPTYSTALSNKRVFLANLGPNGIEDHPTQSMTSASTVDLGATNAKSILITGATGPIISFGATAPIGTEKTIYFSHAPAITRSATLETPNGAGITASANFVLKVVKTADAGTDGWLAVPLAGHQPVDADLTAIAALSSTGIIARTGAGTAAVRAITGPAAGISVSNGDGVLGSPTLSLTNDLAAIEGLSGTGLAVRSATDTWLQRLIAGTANEITVANGDGVSGSPTISLPSALAFGGKTVNGGTYASPTAITGLPNPTNAQDAATKAYVDAVAAGLDTKDSAKAATTANITLSGTQTIDGVSCGVGDRVLVKNQSAPAENGIYVVAAGAWTRATQMDAWAEVPSAYVFVEEGTLFGDCGFTCTSNAGGTLGTTAITWTQFSGAGTYTAGTGLSLTGTQFAINDAELLALAALVSAANKLPYFTGGGTADLADLTAFARTLLDDANAPAGRATLGAAAVADVQVFTANNTWTKPAGAVRVLVEIVGPGGGGGGGARTASGNASSGGGAGGGGSGAAAWFSAGDLGATESVTVGSAGTGGAGATADGNAGSDGTAGGNASFGSHLMAFGGGLGAGGQLAGNSGGGAGAGFSAAGGNATGATAGTAPTGGTSGGSGGAAGNNTLGGGGGAGGSGGTNGAAGTAAGLITNFQGAPGGGSGAGVSTAPAAFTGGNGGRRHGIYSGAAGGTAGNPGTAGTSNPGGAGGGGGGGGSNVAGGGAAGGAGGNGATGAGGGGGGSAVGGNGGAGGNGGSGVVRVTTYF